MTSRWRNLDPRFCKHCQTRIEVKTLRGPPPDYCGKLCKGRSKHHRAIIRELQEQIADAGARQPKPARPRGEGLTVGQEFARFREQRRQRLAAKAREHAVAEVRAETDRDGDPQPMSSGDSVEIAKGGGM